MDEFRLIKEIFAPLAQGVAQGAAQGAAQGEAPSGAPAFGLTDDAAVFDPPQGRALVFTKDMMMAGVHFPADEDAGLVAQKLLRVNLSDLAAMGAAPHGYLLGLAVGPDTDVDWIRAFAAGLAADQQEFGIALWGGDTVAWIAEGAGGEGAGLVLSLTAIGSVPVDGGALLRSGAQFDDLVFVSGTIGDGALGLKCVQGALPEDDFLAARYRLPTPRLALGQALSGLATSCIDISDGLLADLGHLAEVSGCGAEIKRDQIPLSGPAKALVEGDGALWSAIVSGGDDYELAFTAPAGSREAVLAAAVDCHTPITEIGRMKAGDGVLLLDRAGDPLKVDGAGFQHTIG